MNRINFLIGFGLIFLMQCKQKESKTLALHDSEIASYKTHQLKKSEIEKLLTDNISKKDSAELVKNYIENWMKEKLLLEEAKVRLNQSKRKEIQEKVEQYNNDLLLNEYTNYLIDNLEIDTIQQSVIQDYYNRNQDNFILNKDIYKIVYITCEKTQESNAKLYLTDAKNIKIEQFSHVYKTPSYDWNSKHEISAIGSQKMAQQINQNGIHENQTLRTEDQDGNVELLYVVEVHQKGEVAPLNYVKSSIKNRLINKRKLILLNKLKNQLYDHAKQKNEIEIFQQP